MHMYVHTHTYNCTCINKRISPSVRKMNDSQAGKAERPIAADILMDAQSPTWIILKHSVRMSFSSYARMCGFMYVRMF